MRQLDPRTGVLSPIAGTNVGLRAPAGDGGLPADAVLYVPCVPAVDASGDMAVTDSFGVHLIARTSGTLFGQQLTAGHIYTVAGKPDGQPVADGLPATSVSIQPTGLAFDHSGNVLITDPIGVLVVPARSGTFYGQAMTAGDVYIIAGTDETGFSGDGGPATAAAFDEPDGVAVDAAGNVVISDGGNFRIRVVAAQTGTFYGIAMTAGDVYTVAGQHFGGYYGDSGPAMKAEFCDPGQVAFDQEGNLVIADSCNDRIRVVVVRDGTFYGRVMKAGYIYSIASGLRFAGGGPSSQAGLSDPTGVAVDGNGNVVIADLDNNLIKVVADGAGTFYGRAMTAGHVYAVAGDGQAGFSGVGRQATRAEIGQPESIAAGPAGTMMTVLSPEVAVLLVARQTGTFFGQKMTAGDLYTIMSYGPHPLRNGGPAVGASFPIGVAQDAHGDLLLASSPSDYLWVVPARTGWFYGQRMTAGRIYAIAGNGTAGNSGHGGPALRASLENIVSVAIDRFGDIAIGEEGLVRLSAYSRVLLTAGRTGKFYGVAMRAGRVYLVAGQGSRGDGSSGQPALKVRIDVDSVQFDPAGNLLIADQGNKVRVVARAGGSRYGQAMTAGYIYTVLGDGKPGSKGDGGPAAKAELYAPRAVAGDSAGNLLVADTGNSRIQVVPSHDGTYYGLSMTAGHVYTIAGGAVAGFSGDGGPAAAAELDFPRGIAVSSEGVLVSDTDNSRIRLITG
jgi:hypothetical protein